MPYIITTGIQTTDSGTNFESVAVATIEEARDFAHKAVDTSFGDTATGKSHDRMLDLACDARNLPDSGGTIGPMPDGYVIDVTPVCWNWIIGMAEDAGIDTDAIYADGGDLAILATYNDRTSTIVVDVSEGEDPREALAAYAASTDLLTSFTIQGEV